MAGRVYTQESRGGGYYQSAKKEFNYGNMPKVGDIYEDYEEDEPEPPGDFDEERPSYS